MNKISSGSERSQTEQHFADSLVGAVSYKQASKNYDGKSRLVRNGIVKEYQVKNE